MKGKSILLALSGSQQSRYATEVCWNLATQLKSTITAHHVVDSHSAWEFIGHENPAFLKSDSYLNAYQQLCKSLFCLGEELAEAYTSEAKKRGVDDICIVDEGNPIAQICKRALDHKLVVIGHRPHSAVKHTISAGDEGAIPHAAGQFMRLSIAEALSNECARPLLVVQDKCTVWTSMTIMISMDHINEVFINSCLDMAMTLNVNPVLLCLSSGTHEEPPESFIKDIRESNRRLKDVPMAVAPADGQISVYHDNWCVPDGGSIDKKQFQNTLVVIPTRKVAGERITVVDSSPALFVRHLTLPSILLWPEEYVYSIAERDQSKAASRGAAI
jgi:nucleotide-binding universal stress UspA family protein